MRARTTKAVVAGDHGPAFTNIDVLEDVKAEGPGVAVRAAIALLVFHADGLAGILDNNQIVLLRNRHDRTHIGGDVDHVGGNDCAGITRDLSFDILWTDCQALADIDQNGHRPDHGGGGSSDHPGEGRDQHFGHPGRCRLPQAH